MNEEERRKIEQIVEARKRANGFYLKHSQVFRAYTKLESAAFSDGALSKMHKELQAVAVSVVMNCESCMEWHIHEALLSGATREQVLEAVGVGMEMGGGPATVSARFAMNVLEYYE